MGYTIPPKFVLNDNVHPIFEEALDVVVDIQEHFDEQNMEEIPLIPDAEVPESQPRKSYKCVWLAIIISIVVFILFCLFPEYIVNLKWILLASVAMMLGYCIYGILRFIFYIPICNSFQGYDFVYQYL